MVIFKTAVGFAFGWYVGACFPGQGWYIGHTCLGKREGVGTVLASETNHVSLVECHRKTSLLSELLH